MNVACSLLTVCPTLTLGSQRKAMFHEVARQDCLVGGCPLWIRPWPSLRMPLCCSVDTREGLCHTLACCTCACTSTCRQTWIHPKECSGVQMSLSPLILMTLGSLSRFVFSCLLVLRLSRWSGCGERDRRLEGGRCWAGAIDCCKSCLACYSTDETR